MHREIRDKEPVRIVGREMRFRVLGPVMATNEYGHPFDLGGPKQRTVLAMLVSRVGMPVTADVIVDAVYGQEPHAAARRTVQTYVSNLRRELGEIIVKEREGWSLRVERESVDALQFEELHSSGSELMVGAPEEAGMILREALSLWRGRPYADVEAHGYLEGEIARLGELRVAAQASRIDADLAMGRHPELISELEPLLVEYPYQERFRAQHMLALYRQGRQKEALQSYSDLRKLLVEQLGVDPAEELQDLERRILDHDPSLMPAPPVTVSRKAVLAADPGDVIGLSNLSAVDRLERVTRADGLVRRASSVHDGQGLSQAGTAIYAFFDDPVDAVLAAENASLGGDAEIRIAVAFGEVETSEEGVSGPPVQRAARLLATAHPGQVLLSSEAQGAVANSGLTGVRIEALGRFELSGLDEPLVVHQLLVGEPLRTFPDLITDRPPPPLPHGGGRPLPGYELYEPIGPGSLGIVHRAYQPTLGREVVVEVIGKRDASQPDFIRRFEAEAHRLSLLEHPHVLPVLDYWRDTTGAFVVYPYYQGGTLANPIVAFDGDRVLTQVASALSYAHEHGLVHGSLRPDRVTLDEGGNAYLYGFPLADAGDPSPDFAEYIPPERFEGARLGAAADVFACGVLAYELLTGRTWDPDESLSTNLPGIDRATSSDLSRRQTTIEELMDDLGLVDSESPDDRFTRVRNPYKGLAAFQEADAGDFFGRSEATEELAEVLGSLGFVAVVGPSGIGKSSLVRAGLIPALRNDAIPGSRDWVVTDMVPGSQPFQKLGRAVERVAVELAPDVWDLLDNEDPLFFSRLDDVLPRNSDLLLVVDQFEELFTMPADQTRVRFLQALLTAARSDRCRIVTTLRADFLDRPLRFSEFGDLLRRGLFTLGAPSREDLAEVVTGPASNVGIDIEPALVERLVSEVHDKPGALPLLQYMLAELFEARGSDVITLGSYMHSGGVSGSLAQRAEGIFSGLSDPARVAARQLLMRLVSLDDQGSLTRRRVRIGELSHLDLDGVVDAFVEGRLLVTDRDPVTHTPTVEVAHEALISYWPRLAGWIDQWGDHLRMHRRLIDSLREWEANAHRSDYLLSPSRVEQHLEWASDTQVELNDDEREFIEASRLRNEAQQRRRRRRRQGIIAVLAAAAVVAVWFGMAAQVNAREARVAELLAEGRANLEVDPELTLLLGISAAEEAGGTSSSIRSLLHQSLLDDRKVSTYQWPTDREIVLFLETALSPDGSILVATGNGSYLEAWDLATDRRRWSSSFAEGSVVMGPVFNRDGSLLMVGVGQVESEELAESDLGLFILDPETGETVDHVETGPCGAGLRPEAVDDDWTVVSYQSYTLEDGSGCTSLGGPFMSVVMDLASGERLAQRVTVVPDSHPAAISPDGAMAAWLDIPGSVIEVVSLDSGETTTRLELEGRGPFWPPAFSTDGRLLVYGRPPRVWDVASGEVVTSRFEAGVPDAEYSSFHADDDVIVTTRLDGGVSIWDPETGTDYYTFTTGYLVNNSSMEGTLVSVGGLGPRIFTWEIGNLAAELAYVETCPAEFRRRTPAVVEGSLDVSGSAASVVVYCPGDSVPTTVLFDSTSGEVRNRFEGTWGQSPVVPWGQGSALAPDGSQLVLQDGSSDPLRGGAVRLYPTSSDAAVVQLHEYCATLGLPIEDCGNVVMQSSSYSPDARYLAIVGGTSSASGWGVWDAVTGAVVSRGGSNGSGGPWPSSVVFSPDGSRLYVGNNVNAAALIDGGDLVEIYETTGWSRIGETDPDGADFESQLGPFTAHGEVLVGLGASGLGILDADTGNTLQHMPGNFTVADLSADDRLLATGNRDGLVEVWDFQALRESGAMVLVEEIPLGSALESVEGVRFVGSDQLWVATLDGRIQLYTLDPDELLSTARDRLTRTFTEQECEVYAIDPCPTLQDIRADN